MVKTVIGEYIKSKESFKFDFPENKPDLVRNYLLFDKQGSGKTNLLMNICFEMYKLYYEREGKYGCLPIVFSPFFEWATLGVPSKENNLSPFREPESLETIQLTFTMSRPQNPTKFKIIAFDFKDLTVEDIGSFANAKTNEALGKIRKIINMLKEGYTLKKKGSQEEITAEPNPDYTIKDFLQLVEILFGVADSLYYVFAKLNDNDFFNVNIYGSFDWLYYIKQRKPIIISFGNITDKNMYQAVGGYMLRKLFELSNRYFDVFLKASEINSGMIENNLTPDEEFLLKYYKISLLFEEAHQFFPNTTSTTLTSFPVIDYYMKISQQVGRKQGHKFNFLISQKSKFLYHGLRMEADGIFLGSKLSQDDRELLKDTYKSLDDDLINYFVRLPKFSFCLFHPNRFTDGLGGYADKFKVYRSPSGMPN